MDTVRIKLHGSHGKGKFALVDGDYDGEWFNGYKWYLNPGGYVVTAGDNFGKPHGHWVYLHKLVAGKHKRGLWVDHINRNKLDNRSCNIRIVTPYESHLNRDVGLDKRKRFTKTEKAHYRLDKTLVVC